MLFNWNNVSSNTNTQTWSKYFIYSWVRSLCY